jgi:Fe-S cluster assembly protein SufD
VFVNGRFAPELSDTAGLAPAVRVVSLGQALAESGGSWADRLGRLADLTTSPFAALNTAYMADGAAIVAPRGVKLDKPVHLVHLVRPGDAAAVHQPRNLFVIEDGAEATVIETYAAVAAGAYWTNAVTEIVVGANARLDHYKLQIEDHAAYHTSTTQVRQGADSAYANHSLSFGALLARNDINVSLDGENVDCRLMGLFVVDGARHVDHHTQVDHAKPRGRSDENYRGILGGKATGVFRGRIHVHQDAQKTDAYQNNKNLLLTREATVHTKPQLEIYADDVKCSHGATVGQLDDEAVFYLRSRGIDTLEARRLLIRAFAGTIVDGIRVEALREHLDAALSTLLPTDALERESA